MAGNWSSDVCGTYRWKASYGGDANNNGASTACNDSGEASTVNKATPTIGTTLSDTSITVDGSASDGSALSGASVAAGGSVTYTVYDNNLCTTGARDAGTKTVTGAVVPDSSSLAFHSAGDFWWQAVY